MTLVSVKKQAIEHHIQHIVSCTMFNFNGTLQYFQYGIFHTLENRHTVCTCVLMSKLHM